MDSKSVHRVASSLQVAARYDSKLKVWTIDGKTFTVDEISKLSSTQLRKAIRGDTSEPAAQQQTPEQKQEAQGTSDAGAPAGESDLAKASALLQQTGGGVTAALQEHAANVAAGKEQAVGTKKGKKKGGGTKKQQKAVNPDIIQVACVKVTFPAKKKAKRTSEDDNGKIWLPSVGISKWQTRQKMIARDNKEGAKELNKNKTQYLTPAEARQFAKYVFDDTDKKILASPDKYSERAVKYAKDARDAAEALLAAASK